MSSEVADGYADEYSVENSGCVSGDYECMTSRSGAGALGGDDDVGTCGSS